MPFLEMPKPNLPEDDPDQDRLGSLPYYISSDGKSYSAGEAFEILKKSDAKFLGDGFECLVVTFPNLPDKAIAYSFWNPSENFDATRAKTTFYVHRIFSTLFPHNFPKIHAALVKMETRIKEQLEN